MASLAAFVTECDSDNPNATVLFQEGIVAPPPAVSCFGFNPGDGAADDVAGGGWGTAMKRGVGSGRGAKMSRNRRGGAAVAAVGKMNPTIRPPTIAHASGRL